MMAACRVGPKWTRCSEEGPGCEKIAIGAGPPETNLSPKRALRLPSLPTVTASATPTTTWHGVAKDGRASGRSLTAPPGVFCFFWQTQNAVVQSRSPTGGKSRISGGLPTATGSGVGL